jgi:hypothetical protein
LNGFKIITIRKTAEITLSANSSGLFQAFSPESFEYCTLQLAGLLAHSFFAAFPSRLYRDSGIVVQKNSTEFTAAGTAPEFNRIPS